MNRLLAISGYVIAFFGAQQLQGEMRPIAPTTPASCSLFGQVLEYDAVGQGFVLQQDGNRQTETVPFSRWTTFLDVPSGLKIGPAREIEPAAIRIGDRLCVVFDSNEAIARFVFVLRSNPVVGRRAPETKPYPASPSAAVPTS